MRSVAAAIIATRLALEFGAKELITETRVVWGVIAISDPEPLRYEFDGETWHRLTWPTSAAT